MRLLASGFADHQMSGNARRVPGSGACPRSDRILTVASRCLARNQFQTRRDAEAGRGVGRGCRAAPGAAGVSAKKLGRDGARPKFREETPRRRTACRRATSDAALQNMPRCAAQINPKNRAAKKSLMRHFRHIRRLSAPDLCSAQPSGSGMMAAACTRAGGRREAHILGSAGEERRRAMDRNRQGIGMLARRRARPQALARGAAAGA